MKVETKTEEINWDKPHLVVSKNGIVALTNGKHDEKEFQCFSIDSKGLKYSYCTRLKSEFILFHGTISNEGIKHEEPKFQPVTITIESEEELCDVFHRFNISSNEIDKTQEYIKTKYMTNDVLIVNAITKLDEIVKQRNLYK